MEMHKRQDVFGNSMFCNISIEQSCSRNKVLILQLRYDSRETKTLLLII